MSGKSFASGTGRITVGDLDPKMIKGTESNQLVCLTKNLAWYSFSTL